MKADINSGKKKSKAIIKESLEDQSDKNSGSMLNQKTYEDYNKERPNPEDPNQKPADNTIGINSQSSTITKTKNKMKSGIKTYTCAMHPAVAADKPGKCPTCGMELIQRPS